MKTLFPLLALTFALAAGTSAQEKAPAKPAPPAAAKTAGPSADSLLESADKGILTLGGAVANFQSCVEIWEFMKKDVAEAHQRAAPGGGQAPLSQSQLLSQLLALKLNRLGRQRALCVAQMNAASAQIAAVSVSLASVEPPDHPGVQPRRAKLLALVETYNAVAVRFSVPAVPSKNLAAPDRKPAFSGKKSGFSKF
jgi:hypothetical protein